jgi:hypothetical protein
MIDGHRVIGWCPYGRERTVSILVEYMARDHARGLIDEFWLYLNTDPEQTSDLRYAYQLAREHDWVKVKNRPTGTVLQRPKQRNTGYAYRLFVDPAHVEDPANTIFVRLDDDIVYVHDTLVERLVKAKIEMPHTMCVFPFIVNNAVCSWFAQQLGKIPFEWGTVGAPYCMDPTGWANGPFAVKLHEMVLDHIEAGTVDDLLWYQDYSLQVGQQFSVSCFASSGADYLDLQQPGVLVPDEEESWHTVHRTRATGQPNMIRGDSLVSHLTFFPQTQQSPELVGPILDRYRAIAKEIAHA